MDFHFIDTFSVKKIVGTECGDGMIQAMGHSIVNTYLFFWHVHVLAHVSHQSCVLIIQYFSIGFLEGVAANISM